LDRNNGYARNGDGEVNKDEEAVDITGEVLIMDEVEDTTTDTIAEASTVDTTMDRVITKNIMRIEVAGAEAVMTMNNTFFLAFFQ
jgi:hypothetical protein